jgi:hypothetical protein
MYWFLLSLNLGAKEAHNTGGVIAKSPQTASSSPTSTRMPSAHYKRGCGARWRSSLSSSQAFQVFQALRSSPRVVA